MAAAPTEKAILDRLAGLRPSSTMCPGMLAKEFGSTQKELRPLYLQLARSGKIRLTQGGVLVDDLDNLRGAYRVSLPETSAD